MTITTYTIKSCGGDRAQNLKEIGEWIQELFPVDEAREASQSGERRLWSLRGKAEQLFIIANELKALGLYDHIDPEEFTAVEGETISITPEPDQY